MASLQHRLASLKLISEGAEFPLQAIRAQLAQKYDVWQEVAVAVTLVCEADATAAKHLGMRQAYCC